ncbi:MAG: DinB family protein [Chloroflexi bacterium]|nr:DinB family protein [Chloroflexota bacterium]
MAEAEQLAEQLEAELARVNDELAAIAEPRWSNSVTQSEGWSVGHTAHHIAEGYALNRTWIEKATSQGHPVVLDPAIDIPAQNEANARCLAEHGDEPREQTLRLLQANAQQLVATVRALSEDRLEAPMMVVAGSTRTGRELALGMPLFHANRHLESIRAAP